MTNKRKKYERAFKIDIVEQVVSGAKTVAEISAAYNVEPSSVCNWLRQFKGAPGTGAVFPGNGKLSTHEDEIRRLRRRVAQLEEERAILKKRRCSLRAKRNKVQLYSSAA